MLSVWPIESAAAAVSYFEKDNYYTEEGGYEHSAWCGKGAELLGLKNEINPDEFSEILHGILPNGEHISTKSNNKKKNGEKKERIPGTDLTFSAPKSVSIAALVGGDVQIIEAHKRAVSVALKFTEDHTSVSVRKEGRKSVFERTGNLLIARFDHDTARETGNAPPDPQLHSHCVVINATQRADGKWVAAPNTLMMRHQMLIGAIYRAELAHELQNLGYRVQRTHDDGRFEIVGYSREQIEAFSNRRLDIEEYMKENNLHSGAGSSVAALKTRRIKKASDRRKLKDSWIAAAHSHNIELDPDAIKNAPRHGREIFQEPIAAEQESHKAVSHLSERKSVVEKYELLKVAMQRSVGFARLPDVLLAFNKLLKSKQIIRIAEDKFTTPKLIELEESNLEIVKRNLQAQNTLVDAVTAKRTAKLRGLNEGQAEAVALLASSSRFVGVQGYAGTGKTTMLKVVNELARSNGFEIRGFAPTASAAKSIETEAGIKSQTLDSFLLAEKRRKRRKLSGGNRKIWVVDEASMLSTQKANRLLRLAERQDASVWLIGDKRQLASIEAGGPFALAIKRGMPFVEMKEIVRQKKGTVLRAAVERAIADKPKEALKLIESDVVEEADRTKCLNKVVAEYFNGKKGIPNDAIVITAANEDRKKLNQLIRTCLIKDGVLGDRSVEFPMLTKKHLSKEEVKRIWSYEQNDIVTFRRSYDSLKINKGDIFAVTAVDAKTGTVSLKHQETKVLVDWMPRKASQVQVFHPEEKTDLRTNDFVRWTINEKQLDVRNGETATVKGFRENGEVEFAKPDGSLFCVDLKKFPHWDHAYNSTIYASQGKTFDRVIIHVDTSRNKKLLGKEPFYVAISRGRNQAKIFTNDAEALPKAIFPSRVQENAVEVRDAAKVPTKEAARNVPTPSRGHER
jgi:conjugative relaxase-like TrwC/TraI family protein